MSGPARPIKTARFGLPAALQLLLALPATAFAGMPSLPIIILMTAPVSP